MEESIRKKYENSIMVWSTFLGLPLGISLAIMLGFKVPMSISLPASIIISIFTGLIFYIILLKGEIKDLKKIKINKKYGKKK